VKDLFVPFEIHEPGLAGRLIVAFFVADAQRADQRAAHRARVSQPVGAAPAHLAQPRGILAFGHPPALLGSDDALGPPGGARAVEHRAAHPLVGQALRRVRGDGLLVARPALDRAVDHQPMPAAGHARAQAIGQVPHGQ
jgi:hypothetical protein